MQSREGMHNAFRVHLTVRRARSAMTARQARLELAIRIGPIRPPPHVCVITVGHRKCLDDSACSPRVVPLMWHGLLPSVCAWARGELQLGGRTPQLKSFIENRLELKPTHPVPTADSRRLQDSSPTGRERRPLPTTSHGRPREACRAGRRRLRRGARRRNRWPTGQGPSLRVRGQ